MNSSQFRQVLVCVVAIAATSCAARRPAPAAAPHPAAPQASTAQGDSLETFIGKVRTISARPLRSSALTLEAQDPALAKALLLRPRMFFSEAQSLRDVLALIHGVAVGRYPPHGSGFLPGFHDFLCRRFRTPSHPYYVTLLEQFGQKPWLEGCKAIAELLEEWKAAEEDQHRAGTSK